MKKVSLGWLAAFICLFISVSGVHAQESEKNAGVFDQQSFAFIAKNARSIDTSFIGSNYEHINSRAVRNFIRYYEGSSDAVWSQSKNGRIMCRFVVDDIVNRAFYDNKGNWQYTVAGYAEDKLPGEIKDMVKSVYYDYAITYVNEIDLPKNEKAYFVQVQNNARIKILRINAGEMELFQEFSK